MLNYTSPYRIRLNHNSQPKNIFQDTILTYNVDRTNNRFKREFQMRKTCIIIVIVIISVVSSLGADSTNYSPRAVAELPEIKELPNPFVFADGSLIQSKEDWQRRRKELKELFEAYEYGHLPAKPEKMIISRGGVIIDQDNEAAIQNLKLNLENGDKTFTMRVRLTMPRNAAGPAPVVIKSVFGRFDYTTEDAREARMNRFLGLFIKRGYAVAEFSMVQVAADSKEQPRTAGIYQLFGSKIDCGALMAWAWGFHRVIDAIETVDTIDSKKVVVTGHSRYGKAALLAGAFDERIALTIPSHSGCAGTAPYRFIYGKSEQLHNIVGYAPQWFRPDFNLFVDNVERLPVDQHLLLALVAPRGLLTNEGTKDSWTNPQGSQLTYLAAKKVYDFLETGDKISIRYRPVGHVPNNEDLLDFADYIFFQKPLPDEFGRLQYPEEKSGFTWDVPK